MEEEYSSRSGSQSTAIPPDQIGGLTRFYEKEFPDLEECVIVKVRSVADMGAYVQLLEYNNIEGMVLLSELSRRRIRSINKLIKVGRDEVVMVIRVDKDKGYIDLSKRRVSAEEIVKAEDRFNKAKMAHSILKHVSQHLSVPMLSLYTRVGWPLYRKFGHAYTGLSMVLSEADTAFEGLDISPAERDEIVKYVGLKMTPQPLRVRADVQVTCFAYEGILAVREALAAAQAVSTEEVPIRVQLIAPPLYVMTTQCLDREAGIAALTRAIAAAQGVIDVKGGQLHVKMAPTVTSAKEETELARMLADLEAANAEVSGDDDSDEDSESDEGGAGSDAEGGAAAAAEEEGGAAAGAPPAKGKGKKKAAAEEEGEAPPPREHRKDRKGAAAE